MYLFNGDKVIDQRVPQKAISRVKIELLKVLYEVRDKSTKTRNIVF